MTMVMTGLKTGAVKSGGPAQCTYKRERSKIDSMGQSPKQRRLLDSGWAAPWLGLTSELLSIHTHSRFAPYS